MTLDRARQPWLQAWLARMYDAFPFDEDVPMYLASARTEGGDVLEAACGTGRLMVPLAEAGHRVVGVDSSPAMLAIAAEKVARSGDARERCRLVEADLRSFDVPGTGFGLAILAAQSFAYLLTDADRLAFLVRVRRHLRPGGAFVVELRNPASLRLDDPPDLVRRDLVSAQADGSTVVRDESTLSVDRRACIRVVRSNYRVTAADGTVTERAVEWSYRWTEREEMERLLHRTGFVVESVDGGYDGRPFTPSAQVMLFRARGVGGI